MAMAPQAIRGHRRVQTMVSLITIGKAGRKPRPYHTHLTSRSPRTPREAPRRVQGAHTLPGGRRMATERRQPRRGQSPPPHPAAPPPDPAQAVW